MNIFSSSHFNSLDLHDYLNIYGERSSSSFSENFLIHLSNYFLLSASLPLPGLQYFLIV